MLAYDSYPRPVLSRPNKTHHQQEHHQPPPVHDHPPVQNIPPPNIAGPGPATMPPQGPPPQGFNVPPNLNLPPDLAGILSQIQNNKANNGDPLMAQVQQIINSLMVSVINPPSLVLVTYRLFSCYTLLHVL